MLASNSHRRSGASVVEFAVVAPLFVVIIFGLIVGGVGVFRYNLISSLAREAARVGSVQGIDYERETNKPAATQDSLHTGIVLAKAAALDPARLTTAVSWDRSNAPKHFGTDKVTTTNHIIVTVSYRWQPAALFGQEITLASTSRMPMSH